MEWIDVFDILIAGVRGDVPDSAGRRRQVLWTEARVRHLAAVNTTTASAETIGQRRISSLVVNSGGGESCTGCQRRRETKSREVLVAARPVGVVGGGGGRRTGVTAALDGAPETGRAIQRQRVVDDVVAVVLAVGVDGADDGDADTAGRRGRRRASAAAPHQLRPRAGHADVDAARARPGRRVLRRVAVHGQVAAAARRRRHLRRRTTAAAGGGRSRSRLDDAAVRRLTRRPADTVQVRAGRRPVALRLHGVVRGRTLLQGDVGRTLGVVTVEHRVS